MATGEAVRRTDSGIEIRSRYVAEDLEGFDPVLELGEPGVYPYTRGVQRRHVPWPALDDAPVRRVRDRRGDQRTFQVPARGRPDGLSCAFDLPTQMGYDSDHPLAEGEVGKVGVAIDSIDDMRSLLPGFPSTACPPR